MISVIIVNYNVKDYLYQSLETLYKSKIDIDYEVLVVNNSAHADEHPEFFAEVAIRNDIGFRWNKNTENYELVAELDTWDLDVPVSRFIEKVTQQYARTTMHNTVKEEGFEVAEEWEMDDNSIELVVTRWN